MRSFNQFIEHQNIGPLIEKAAVLMVELEIDPEEYLTLLMENPMYNTGLGNAATGAGQVVSGAGSLGKGLAGMAGGAVAGAYNAAGQAGNAIGKSAMGQGVKGWWQTFQSADRKIERAKALLTKAMSDPHVVNAQLSNGGNGAVLLQQIIGELNQIAVASKQARLGATP